MVKREILPGPTSAVAKANVKEFRERAGLSYAELSRQLEELGRTIPPLGLRRMEAGERRIDIDDLTALAVALDVSPARLLAPGVSSTGVKGNLTGTGQQTTEALWLWLLGYRGLGTNDSPNGEFRRRSSPKTVWTYRERVHKRRQWLGARIDELDKQIKDLESDDDVAFGSRVRDQLVEEVEALENADPENDELFAEQFGDEDPAPPSKEELDGLLGDKYA